MTSLELVSHPLCPYVQRAAIVLREKGAPFLRTDVDLGNRPDWFKALSPLGKVPLLKTEGEILFESAVICDYLDETIGPRLHPEDPLQRAKHRAWVEFASAVLNEIGGLYSAPNAAAFAAKENDIAQKFARLEQAIGDGPLFNGAAFSIVDAAFAPVFRYFDVFESFVALDVFKGLPKVSAWRQTLRDRESVRLAVGADYPERLRAFLKTRHSYMATLAA
ncbi:glutathione S-transferase family protein [Microvirga rosea]|uniref:glutathione S-transferase family protein n=1 Tax=Microvirga rosea TaxID=2715425 RepID=UPI001D09C87C|nr:glutathione S-transferase family protein [Microvirga rosea]MCB8820111.1 glutathione S-transferase family protein [Microvirga rosea]